MRGFRHYFTAILFSLVVFNPSCTEITDITPIYEIGFLNEVMVVSEAAGSQIVTLELSRPMSVKGSLKLSSSSENAGHWINFPSVIQILPGKTKIDFFISPINNAVLDNTRQIQLIISEPSTGLVLNANFSLTINISDDEAPAQANFVLSNSTIAENNSTGIFIAIAFSAQVPGSGNLTLTYISESAIYGTHFTTEPVMNDGVLVLPYSVGQTTLSFKVVPINNSNLNLDYILQFSITTSSNQALEVGTNLPMHILTISEDEIASVANFSWSESAVVENADDLTVTITLQPTTSGTGSISVAITEQTAQYGSHFTTQPNGSSGTITLPIANGASSATIKIFPIDNAENNSNRIFKLTLANTTGIVLVGNTITQHTVALVDDEID
jgi:hypothetical protein